MKFPNAYKGVKKLFIAEILAILAALLMVVAAVLGAIGLKNEPVLLASGTVALVAGIILIIVFVIQIVGLYQGGKDDIQIKYGFYLTILAIVLNLIVVIFGMIKDNQILATIAKYINIAVDIATVLSLVCTLRGIAALANQLGDEKMENRGKSLAFIVFILFVASIVLGAYPNFFVNGAPDWAQTMFAITGIVAGVIELVVYILTVIYYGRATKMLK